MTRASFNSKGANSNNSKHNLKQHNNNNQNNNDNDYSPKQTRNASSTHLADS